MRKGKGGKKYQTWKFSEHVAFALFGILSQVFGKEEERVKKLDYGSIFLFLCVWLYYLVRNLIKSTL